VPSQALTSNNVQMAAALILGVVVLLGVGFAPMDAAHNAAHDTRHSFAFPCH
jgi:cobalt transporter subunit CbtB